MMKAIKENWAIIIFCALLFYIMHVSNVRVEQYEKELKKFEMDMDSVLNINDSLSDALLPMEIELGRYQVAYQILMERNPKAAIQYGTIISEETE